MPYTTHKYTIIDVIKDHRENNEEMKYYKDYEDR